MWPRYPGVSGEPAKAQVRCLRYHTCRPSIAAGGIENSECEASISNSLNNSADPREAFDFKRFDYNPLGARAFFRRSHQRTSDAKRSKSNAITLSPVPAADAARVIFPAGGHRFRCAAQGGVEYFYLRCRGLTLRVGVSHSWIGYDCVAKKATNFSQRIRTFISKCHNVVGFIHHNEVFAVVPYRYVAPWQCCEEIVNCGY
jgi:hypothetical protein